MNAGLAGIVNTSMHSLVREELARLRGSTFAEISQTRLGMGPLGREADPAETAALICFLLSDLSAYITEQAILQDGEIVTA